MTRRLKKKIKRSNKIIEKDLLGNQGEVFFSSDFDEKSVYFEGFDSLTGTIVTGSYDFNKKGGVTSFGFSMGDSGGTAFTHSFMLKNNKSFKKSAKHIRDIINEDTTYANILSNAMSTGNCQALANYLDGLNGVASGSMSTGAGVGNGDLCYA